MIEISIDELDEEIADRVDELLLDIANDLVNELIEEAPVDTGQLRQSFRIMGKSGENSYIIGTPLKYAPILHEGKVPDKEPDIVALKKWVRRKTGRDEGFAYYVKAKIEEEGPDANPFAKRAIENVEKKYS